MGSDKAVSILPDFLKFLCQFIGPASTELFMQVFHETYICFLKGKYIYETGSKNGKRVQSNMVSHELTIIFQYYTHINKLVTVL